MPRLQNILFLAVFAGALLQGAHMLNTDSDLGRHLVLGNYILQSRQIPSHDLLSFTMAGQPRPPYEWLAQVVFAMSYRLLNLDGVVLATALVIALAFALLYTDAAERSGLPLLALVPVLLATAAASIHWLTRPHVFTFLFLVLWSRLLERVRLGQPVALWTFPTLMLLWANTHGGFIFGFLVWGAYFADWLRGLWLRSTKSGTGKALMAIGFSSLAASLLTPGLWHNWIAVLRNNSAYILTHTLETMPPNLGAYGFWPFIALLALALILLLLGWKQAAGSHVLLLVGFALLGLLMARNIPLFAIVAAPILARWAKLFTEKFMRWASLEARFREMNQTRRGGWEVVIALAAVSGFFASYQARAGTPFYQFDPHLFPVQAVDWLEAHPVKGAMFNDFNWGGYLLYRLWPGQRVFIDSQSDFYGEEFVRRYAAILLAETNWEAELDRYGVQWIIVPRGSRLANAAGHSTRWATLYTDPLAIVFVRR